jgi:hypothetical protein
LLISKINLSEAYTVRRKRVFYEHDEPHCLAFFATTWLSRLCGLKQKKLDEPFE